LYISIGLAAETLIGGIFRSSGQNPPGGFLLGMKERNFAGKSVRMPLNPIKPAYDLEESVDVLDATDQSCSLIVWNDEVNTFEWVIDALVEICDHSIEQAEQCAMIIHTHGKYAVKHGSYDELKPMCDAITERGIGATIDVLSAS
jgi:ATP-dependent Clp protease adaptor protein ClpS